MNFDPRKSEYGLVSYSPIKYAESDKLSREVEEFVARGGKIKNLSNGEMNNQNPCLVVFDKSKQELAALAKRSKYFNFACDKHGITKHRVNDLCCAKCIKQKLHDAKLKQITEKHCGVSHGK